MDVELKTSARVGVYDLQTKFATSAVAPGMKALCRFAISNDNRIDQESLVEKYNLSQAAARNLITSGVESGVWDGDGALTDDGYETAQTGEVLIDEVGPLRVWAFDHETTGAVFLHAERLGLLPPADAEPNNGNPPGTLQRLSTGGAAKSLKPRDKRRWRIQYSQKESAWAMQEKFCTPASLSWFWRYDNGWVLDDEIVLKATLSGTTTKPGEDRISVGKNCPQIGALNPGHCIREWLTTGRFSSGPWDGKLGGLTRPFSELTDAEKSMQTTDEILKSEIEEWDYISIKEIPLFAKTFDDAADWAIYLINEETPGYTTTEDTNRKLGDILERPFMCLDSEKVRARVNGKLDSSRADPRLSKLLHAGDDLDIMALTPEWIISQKRDGIKAIHDGSDDFTEFIRQISQSMKGKLKRVTYVNNYLVGKKRVRNPISKFLDSLRVVEPDVRVEILTSHYPYSKSHGNTGDCVNDFEDKIESELNAKVTFMDEGKYGEDAKLCPTSHDRLLILYSDKETRYWKLSSEGLHVKDIVACIRLEETELRKWMKKYLESTNSKIKERNLE